MAEQQFNVGSDSKFTFLVNGQPLFATILTSFEAKQVTTRAQSDALDGLTRARELPKGWDLDIEWDRGNAVVDNFFASEEQRRYDGLPPSEIAILQTTTNPDRSVSRYRFTGVTLKLDTAGANKGDDKVSQKASGFANRRFAV